MLNTTWILTSTPLYMFESQNLKHTLLVLSIKIQDDALRFPRRGRRGEGGGLENFRRQDSARFHVNVQYGSTILQHTATHCNTLKHDAIRCNTLQHTASHCNTLQHTWTRARARWGHSLVRARALARERGREHEHEQEQGQGQDPSKATDCYRLQQTATDCKENAIAKDCNRQQEQQRAHARAKRQRHVCVSTVQVEGGGRVVEMNLFIRIEPDGGTFGRKSVFEKRLLNRGSCQAG